MTTLTIAIPTFNRAKNLRFLLEVLKRETAGSPGDVSIIVSNNASSDNTQEVIGDFSEALPNFVGINRAENIGAEANFLELYKLCQSDYMWIIGDDDAPIVGSVVSILKVLRAERYDALYLPSIPSADVPQDHSAHVVSGIKSRLVSPTAFATLLHAQLTFVSGLIVRKQAASDLSVSEALKLTLGSGFVHLAWVLETLRQGKRFGLAERPLLLATAGNSGGYSVLTVFMVNFTQIVQSLLSDRPKLRAAILSRAASRFFPGLVWNVRQGKIGAFCMVKRSDVKIPSTLSRVSGFRLLVLPIWRLPHFLAATFYQVSRVVNKCLGALDAVRSRLDWVSVR